MKFLRFQHKNEIFHGRIEGETIVAIDRAPWFGDTKDLFTVAEHEIQLLNPCTPNKIVGVALNYPGVAKGEENTEPLVFLKSNSKIVEHKGTINNPLVNTKVWGECELAIVIGAESYQLNSTNAKDKIFGYTIGNDVTAENFGNRDHHLAKSKAVDSFCALGPYIDTEFRPSEQIIKGFHNGVLLREGKLSERLWLETELLVWLTSWMTLSPGDVVLTGAPNRVRDRIYLEDGDEFISYISGLGELTVSFRNLHV
ncbi:fumarylacetoacetate hydrolase family protein [Leptospira harrisiae]|uniref:2-hydroxyhepta-2,4-diene-1,7-dioate isomerase n=1 Tax=Leptospira harrisiae TaxID=2023189 RepID=A0A2N0APQ2_9LEPT|nr:fumarylacetoacetate hydrolase family protein [Leptospira harrisiae]PJZ86292.1 hypothetical protein CH364_09040 [Leptospira harrisiae]PKA09857.1 hypothetical protein CH366_09310 [Leptospira harrisiae]